MGRLFSYLCQKYFDGETDRLSEMGIAKDLFGRNETFDRSQDAIARVEAHRLRKKLRQYYETEGKDHPVRVVLPPGSYVPSFQHMGNHSIGHEAVVEPGITSRVQLVELETPPQPTPEAVPETVPPSPPHFEEGVRPSGKPFRWLLFPGVALALAILAWAVRARLGRTAGAPPPSAAAPAGSAPVAAPSDAIRILCGYDGPPHIDRLGEVWGTDKYFHGGGSWPPAHHRFIRGASDPFLFENMRIGVFSYDIPVPPGVYELHLYFIETDYGEDLGGGENNRTFIIRLNGAELFHSFDPVSDAGGPWIADERVFKDVQPASDGMVHVSVESQRGQPVISAIELLPGTPHRQLPVRLTTQLNSYTDHSGAIWAPDNYYIGGQHFSDKPVVTGTPDPMLFSTERAGNFRYLIPVDLHGTYTVNLFFAETYFGPGASGIGGIGSRVFNVTCNGRMLLDQFDVFKQAGCLRALEKSFHGLKSNAQGKLEFWFEPVANYASVFGIEVLDESK